MRNLAVRDDDGIRTVTLDRPDARNAIDVATQQELGEALVASAEDATVLAIIVTGADPACSAGGDFSRFDETDPARFRFASHELTTVVGLVERIEKPVIAAINGVAAGAGAQLALA